jgi:hypothetical protein
MTTPQLLSILGAAAGSLGSIITAFSVNGVLRALRLGNEAVATSIQSIAESIAHGGNIFVFNGQDEHYRRAARVSGWIVWVGVSLLIAGFALQALSMLLAP